jgi:major membrane immunogen (membrane-anchored lipoprotein)
MEVGCTINRHPTVTDCDYREHYFLMLKHNGIKQKVLVLKVVFTVVADYKIMCVNYKYKDTQGNIDNRVWIHSLN